MNAEMAAPAPLPQSIESRIDIGPESVLGQSRRPHTLLSSIGGFSRPASKRIHTLEDLLRYVQSLGLATFDSSQIGRTALLGQGVSYKVFGGTDTRTGSAIAVKRVKLPSSSANFEAFEHRVTCVLRDIEVMQHAPLAKHKNIIKLLGYGWDYEQRDTIPYLVTELAHQGTLRQYLSDQGSISLKDRLELCGDVINGLYELHLCGVCHGDVKLDNVLVSSDVRTQRPIAKISDFGHSIMLSSEQASVSQYRGTVGYAPPETYIPDARSQAVDIRKCDLWALGLACWETLARGVPYYEIAVVQEALSTTISATASSELSGTTLRSEEYTAMGSKLRDLKKLYELNSQLSSLARRFLETSMFEFPDQQEMSNSLFNGLLNPDPFKRSALVIHLPLFYDRCVLVTTSSRQQLVPKSASEGEWSFEIFKPSRMSLTPVSAKKKIFQDFQVMVAHKDPVQASRANLHVAYAYATGFGVEQSLSAFRTNLQKCTDDGLQIVTSMRELFKKSKWLLSRENSIRCYSFFIRSLLRRLMPAPKLYSDVDELSYGSLEVAARKAAQALGAGVIPASTFAVYHKLTQQIPYGVLVNEQHPTTGETSLATACRLGDYQATVNLLDRGADPSIRDHCGCLPLHWLCMFDDQHITVVATRLTQDWGLQNINCKSTTPRVPDAQFPMILHGTALAFAVTMCSIQAVETLLAAGADALCGFTELDTDWGDRSAVTIAVCLHLVDILSLLWPDVQLAIGGIRPLPPAVASLPCALPTSSTIERCLIHGGQWHSAMQRMITFLRDSLSFYKSSEISSYAPIEAAVKVMDLEIAESLLKIYYSSYQEAKDQLFRVCINMACSGTLDWKESTSLLDFALSQGCDINATFYLDGRAIDMLINRRQGRILQDWLICKNPEMIELFTENQFFSPVYAMIENGLSNVVPIEDLLSRGANPNSTDPGRTHTALHLAIERRLVSDVRTLLNYGASPLAVDGWGTSVFHFAVSNGNIPILKEILPFVQDVNVLDTDGKSALYTAARLGRTEVATLLLQHGSLSKVGNDPQTALHVAAANAHHGPLIAIIKSGQDLNLRNSDDNTPLLMVIQSLSRTGSRGHLCAISLLEAGANPSAHGKNLAWPVHMTFRHSRGRARLDLVQKLHEFGAGLDVRRSDGTSLLHLAAFMRDTSMVQYLLNAGVSPVCRGNRDQTPLHDCVRSISSQQKCVISELDVESTCRIVEILADAGRRAPFKPHARYYASAGAEQTQDFDRHPAIGPASKRGNVRTKVEGLLRKRQEERAAENRREMIAMENRIVGYGVTLFRDRNNETALELAALRKSDQEVLKVLLRIHRDHLEEESGIPQNNKIQDGESNGSDVDNKREHQNVIDAGWRAAVGAENWPAVLQFLTHTVPVDLTPLGWPKGGRLLEHSIERNDLNLLKLFMGDGVALDSNQVLPTQRTDWPKFPKLSREFSVDLYYLWGNTRKVRRDRVLGDDGEAYKKRGKRGRDDAIFAWEKCATIRIDSKGRAKARKKVFLLYNQVQMRAAPLDDHPLRQIWTYVQGIDLQTSNFYFGSIGQDPLIIPYLPCLSDDVSQRFRENSNRHQERLLELVGISYLSEQSSAWNEEAPRSYSCAPGNTSIPFALIHDIAADARPNAARAQRLSAMIHDYRDLVTIIENPDFTANVVHFDTPEDRDWYEKTKTCFQELLLWLKNLYNIELDKRHPEAEAGPPAAPLSSAIIVHEGA